MKKILKIAGIVFLALIAAAMLAAISGWGWSFRDRRPVELPRSARLIPDTGEVPAGGRVTASVTVQLPLHASVDKVSVIPGKGSVCSGAPEVRFRRWKWNCKQMEIRQDLRALAPGAAETGTIVLKLHGAKFSAPEGKSEIPGFLITAVKVEDQSAPELAGAVEVKTMSRRLPRGAWWVLGALALAIVLLLCLRRRQQRKAPPLPPWDRALLAIASLRDSLKKHTLTPAGGFLRLTDVVRDYVEARYGLPASRRTTPEFLSAIAYDNPLPAEHQGFLQEFLDTADQVKFACAPPDREKLDQALTQAEKLITATGKPEEGEKK